MTKSIKKTLSISLVILSSFFICHLAKAQTEVYKTVQLKTILSQYTVTATYDTTYAREVVITMSDTTGFQNVSITLSQQTETGWSTLQNLVQNKPLNKTICSTPFCMYRRNELEWVIYLGTFSLLDRYKIELQFNSIFTNTTNTFWENEF